MKHTPLVSIIIPVYNGSDYLHEAIASALGQTYSNCEVLVVNDGSNDGGETERIALSFGTKIRYFSKPNGGVSSALNYGIREMNGEYFCWLSHDDLYLQDKVRHQIEELSSLSPDTILYSPYLLLYPELHMSVRVEFTKKHPADMLDVSLFPVFNRLVCGCTVLFHRMHFERVGFFNETLRTTQDYDFWFRLFQGQRVHCCQVYDVKIRTNRKQGSRSITTHAAEEDRLWVDLCQRISELDMCQIAGSSRLFYLDAAERCSRHGQMEAAAFCGRRAKEVLEKRQSILKNPDAYSLQEQLLATKQNQYEELQAKPPRQRGLRLLSKQNVVYILYQMRCEGIGAALGEVRRACCHGSHKEQGKTLWQKLENYAKYRGNKK